MEKTNMKVGDKVCPIRYRTLTGRAIFEEMKERGQNHLYVKKVQYREYFSPDYDMIGGTPGEWHMEECIWCTLEKETKTCGGIFYNDDLMLEIEDEKV